MKSISLLRSYIYSSFATICKAAIDVLNLHTSCNIVGLFDAVAHSDAVFKITSNDESGIFLLIHVIKKTNL